MFTQDNKLKEEIENNFGKRDAQLDGISCVLQDYHTTLEYIINDKPSKKNKHTVIKITEGLNFHKDKLISIITDIKAKHDLVLPTINDNEERDIEYLKIHAKVLVKAMNLLSKTGKDLKSCENYLFPDNEFGIESLKGCPYKGKDIEL